MPINKCRVCCHEFMEEPLLHYENMPAGAQFFPDTGALESDKGIALKVYQCPGCGLVQLSNDPVFYYKDVIRAAAISQGMQGFRKKQFADFVQRFSLKEKKVIEIGCGCGEFLAIMQQFGVEAYGLEHSAKSVARCAKRGLKVTQGFIQSSADRLKDAPFDAFFILNFLEHLPEINSTLRGIHNNLTDNAIGLIEVPNFDMILRNKLFCEFTSDHLFYFTKETLSTTLSLNGFEIIDCKEVWHEYIISAAVRAVKNLKPSRQDTKTQSVSGGIAESKKLDLSNFYRHQARVKHEIEGYICRFKAGKVAIWGASHQALAVISLMNLADKISYVVDSAVLKQNKFTPVTHLPIVSPEVLAEEPPDAVIVMAASYSDEVARIIRENFDSKIAVSILRDFGLEELQY